MRDKKPFIRYLLSEENRRLIKDFLIKSIIIFAIIIMIFSLKTNGEILNLKQVKILFVFLIVPCGTLSLTCFIFENYFKYKSSQKVTNNQ